MTAWLSAAFHAGESGGCGVEFQVLGPVAVRVGGQVQVVTGKLQRTLLGVLLLHANQPVAVDALADALWGGRPDPRAAQKLQLHVHRVRALLDDPDRLSFGAAGYRLLAAADEIDAERFRALADAAAGLAPQQAVESLRAALALWRGTPFDDVDVPALTDWARQLTERRLTAFEALHQAELECGLHEAVIGKLTELAAEHPLRERLHGLLMTALYRAGRQSDALDVYRRARDTLVAELGLEPGPDLRELHQRILVGDLPEPAPVAAHRDVPAQLPADVRGFTGREAELAELDRMLSAEPPMVIAAVAGTAGVGKTALAVHWAHRVRERFPDGQLYVDLRGYGPDEPVTAADALAGFLRALGLDGGAIPEDLGERAARFRSLVDRKRVLVLIDNARSVDQVRPLLPGSTAGFTLVTSRDALAGLVAREGAHRVGLDRLPAADAVGLLRALLGARADAEPEAVGTLVERCARLPLALRVAAELVRAWPGRAIAELAAELASRQDTLDLLDVDGDPHTAVRAVFSWSYRQLEPAAACVFRLLGVHPGHDVAEDAVAAMAGKDRRDARRVLDALVRANLVDLTPGGRYQPHDLLRFYAAELAATAGDTEEPLARLFDHYLATACAAMDVIAPHEAGRRPKTTGGRTFDSYEAAVSWLDGERANLLAVTQHADERYVCAMSDAVWRYLSIGGYDDDAVTLHTRALHAARALGDAAAEANAHRTLASATYRAGHVSQALAQLERARDLYQQVGNRSLEAAAWNNIGIMHWRLGDLPRAADCFRHVRVIYLESGDDRLLAPALNNLGRVLCILGRYDEARELLELGLANARDSGNRSSEANALCGLARVATDTAEYRRALDHATAALDVARNTGHRVSEGISLRLMGAAHRGLGDHDTAVRHLETALRTARRVGEVDDLMAVLNELAAAHGDLGRPDESLLLYNEVLAVENGNRDEHAHALAGIGDIHAARGEHDLAREYWERALTVYREMGMPHADGIAAKLLTAPPRSAPPA